MRLPEGLRDELKTPLGEVVDEDMLDAILKNVDIIVTVGDKCTLTLYKKGIVPDISVVDFKIQRDDVENLKAQIQEFGKIVINVDNPPGMLTRELWNAVKSAYETEDTVRIEVEGEEDLAALPCVWLAPKNTAVIYGLPNIGLVVVLDEKEAKMKVKDVLKKMK
ncbi:MAG: DUF359 domain-containing protein [Thermoplasmata archaeon]|nr:MAG: DUF359 domain-containing protein [Thermoplasmata archaeon]